MKQLEEETGYKEPNVRRFLGNVPATELPDLLESMEEMETLVLVSTESLDKAELKCLSRFHLFRRELKKLIA